MCLTHSRHVLPLILPRKTYSTSFATTTLILKTTLRPWTFSPVLEVSASNWYQEDDRVISIEKDPQHLAFISQIMREVKTDKCFPMRADVFKYIEKCHEQFDFIFADPPYALKDLESIPTRIFEKGLLKEDGLLVLEHGKDNHFEEDPHFIERRVYGSVNFSFFKAKVQTDE